MSKKDRKGQDIVEWSLVIALTCVVAMTSISFMSNSIKTSFYIIINTFINATAQ